MKGRNQSTLALATAFALAAFTPQTQAASAAKSEPIPMDQIGAVAGKQYSGDGLAVAATPNGARLRCVFQRLEGEATREGLWLSSTANDAVSEPFRVVASSVGREVNADSSNPLAPFMHVNFEGPPGFGLRRRSEAQSPLSDALG